MKTLQQEHHEWVSRKYPGQPPRVPAVGCLEEAGELVHAVLKLEQVQTWGDDARHKETELQVKLVDAIGDCGIFACSLCNAQEWTFEVLWSDAEPCLGFEDAMDAAIALVKIGCDVALRPDNTMMLVLYIAQLKTVATLVGLDAEDCVKTTWRTVKCR
jgi:hypothetical protein